MVPADPKNGDVGGPALTQPTPSDSPIPPEPKPELKPEIDAVPSDTQPSAPQEDVAPPQNDTPQNLPQPNETSPPSQPSAKRLDETQSAWFPKPRLKMLRSRYGR
jgi:hypothetical protein